MIKLESMDKISDLQSKSICHVRVFWEQGHCSVPWEVTLVRWARYQQVRFVKMNSGEGYKMTEKEIEKLKSIRFWSAE